MADSHSLEGLIQALRKLPGVGVKSASRMAFHLLQHDREGARVLSQALARAVQEVRHCERCHTFTEAPVCSTCQCTSLSNSTLARPCTPTSCTTQTQNFS